MNRDDHAAAIRRHLDLLPRFGRGDREHVAALIIESGDMYRDACVLHARREAAGDAEERIARLTESNRLMAIDLDATTEHRDQVAAERDQAVAERDQLKAYLTAAEETTERLAGYLPACPGCGCRTPDDPDGRECGCDEGCNDGDLPPGVEVLTRQRDTAEQRLADVQAEHAKRLAVRDREIEQLKADRDELARSFAALDRDMAQAETEIGRLKAELAAMTRPGPELASLPELGVANEANTAVPAGEAGAEPATNRARTAAAARRRPGAGTRKGQDGTEAPGATQGGTEESGFTE